MKVDGAVSREDGAGFLAGKLHDFVFQLVAGVEELVELVVE